MYRYIDYFIKCCIRRITRLLFNPKILLTILIILIITFFCFKSSVFAVYEGDNTYTDKNATLFSAYDTIANDLVNRLANSTSSTNVITQWLKNSNYNYYLYYGDKNGSSMINSSTYKTDILYIVIFSASSPDLSSTTYDNYQGIDTQIRLINNPFRMYYFEGNEPNSIDTYNSVYAPTSLLTYKNYGLVSYLNNSSAEETNKIVESIEEQTTAIETQTQVQQETQNFIKDETIEEGSMTVDTSSFDTSDSSSVDTFFTDTIDMVKNSFLSINDDDVVTIEIPLPKTTQKLVLRSDIVSRYVAGTTIGDIIQIFYIFLFGGYIVMFAYRIYCWCSTGEIAEKGVSAFIRYLDKNNQIISTYMM